MSLSEVRDWKYKGASGGNHVARIGPEIHPKSRESGRASLVSGKMTERYWVLPTT